MKIFIFKSEPIIIFIEEFVKYVEISLFKELYISIAFVAFLKSEAIVP